MIDFFRIVARQPRTLSDSQMLHQLSALVDDEQDFDHSFHAEYSQQIFDRAASDVKKVLQATTWEAFWQTMVLGKPSSQVANELGLSIGAVYMAKSRVLKKLQHAIAVLEGRS